MCNRDPGSLAQLLPYVALALSQAALTRSNGPFRCISLPLPGPGEMGRGMVGYIYSYSFRPIRRNEAPSERSLYLRRHHYSRATDCPGCRRRATSQMSRMVVTTNSGRSSWIQCPLSSATRCRPREESRATAS